MDAQKTLVVKIGTGMLMQDRAMCKDVFHDTARQIGGLMAAKQNFVILVTSGAIQMGREMLGMDALHESGIEEKKFLAGMGQPELMNIWKAAFKAHGRKTAQLLLTHSNWENEEERRSILAFLRMCRTREVVPVINENDPVSATEIFLMEQRISENDVLAAYVACAMKADILFLTESGGIRWSRKGKIISNLDMRDLGRVDVGCGSANGSGGMGTKFNAIRICAKYNPTMRIVVAGGQSDAILHFAKGEPVGTRIVIGVEQ